MRRRHTDANFEKAATNWALFALLAGFWVVAISAVISAVS